MANQYTQHYDLCQWAPEDAFNRTEFNGDNAKVDAALHGLETGKADQSEVDGLSAAVSGKCQVKVGVYVGNGSFTRFMPTGFTPVAVLVETMSGSRSPGNTGALGGLAVTHGSLLKRGATLIEVVSGGFNVYNQGEANGDFNLSGSSYYYLALG